MNKKISFPIAIIIIIVCAVLTGIITWQYRFIPEIEIPLLTPSEKKSEEIVEVLLNELKEGENKIDNIIVSKIKPSSIEPIVGEDTIMRYEINNMMIETKKRDEEYAVYYDGKIFYKGIRIDAYGRFGVSIFDYRNKKYILAQQEASQGPHDWNIYFIYILDENNNLKIPEGMEVLYIMEDTGLDIIGYNGFLYLMLSSFSIRNGYTIMNIFTLDREDKLKSEKYFEGFFEESYPLFIPSFTERTSLVEKDKKLYMKVGDINDDSYEYYLLDSDNLIESSSEFEK